MFVFIVCTNSSVQKLICACNWNAND